MPIALGTHETLPNRGRAAAEGGRRIRVHTEHVDFVRLEASFSEGRIRDEAREAAAHNGATFRHGYLTEPASRPWTK